MTIVVHVHLQNAAVAYLASYAHGKSGAPPPFGDGLGGNESGMTDSNGNYSAHWVVSPVTPIGPARVDVQVGSRYGQQATTKAFRVGNTQGAC